MAINPTGSTNLLSKYTANQMVNNSSSSQSAAPITPRTRQEDLIEKQKRLIQLQNDEINTLKSQQKTSSSNTVATILSIVGGITILNLILNYKSPRRIQAEMQQAAQQMQEAMNDSVRRAMQAINDADGDSVLKPKEQPKHIIRAIFDSVGKVTGKKIFDRESDRLLKIVEYYPGTQKPATVERYDYINNKINYSWFREDGTKAMEELFDLKSKQKLATFFFKEDGKTIAKTKRS